MTAVFSRAEFLAERWAYQAGEHVTILAPTGYGKTKLGYDLLKRTTKPKLPGVVTVMKPKDPPVLGWSREAGYRVVRSWPAPLPWPWQPRRPPGWVVWPRHTFDPDIDDVRMHNLFRRVLIDSYKRGNRIVFADEVHGLSKELGLERILNAVWGRGRSMGTGLWAASQRPAHIPLLAYGGATHLFLANDPDERTRDRYAEIGGIDPKLILSITASLNQFEFLYIRRAAKGTTARHCVILAD